MARMIGIIHRVKKTAFNEARPTLVCIREGDTQSELRLEDEQAELDFVKGVFPVAYRDVEAGEDLSGFREWHIRRKGEEPIAVPTTYEGIRKDDKLLFVLGGSGDRLAAAASRMAEKVGASVYRLPGFALKDYRSDDSKESDHIILTKLFTGSPQIFYSMTLRDRDLIRVREAFLLRIDSTKTRMACEQRLRQRFVGKIFLNEEGLFPEGGIEDEYDALKASDVIYKTMAKEERAADKELERVIQSLPVWDLLNSIEGCGHRIAGGIVSAVCDVRRFATPAKLRKFCGVHVEADGTFPRKRVGQRCSWNPTARQSLYLLVDQFLRRPGTEWGMKLRANIAYYKAKHPETISEYSYLLGDTMTKIQVPKGTAPSPEQIPEGAVKKGRAVTRYNPGHLLQMAKWRTLSQFVDWLFDAWWDLENREKLGAGGPTDEIAA